MDTEEFTKILTVVLLLMVVVPMVILFGLFGPQTGQFMTKYKDYYNCGAFSYIELHRCDNFPANVTFVRDYEIQCNTWWGGQNVCPREDVRAFLVSNSSIIVSATLNCHYYRVGDSALIKRDLDMTALRGNSTSYSFTGGPC